jgi:hypothetical protein
LCLFRGLLLDLLLRLLPSLSPPASAGHDPDRCTVGGSFSGIVIGYFPDHRAGCRSSDRPAGTGTPANLGGLLLGHCRLLSILGLPLLDLERIAARIIHRPLVTGGLVPRLLGSVLTSGREDLDAQARSQRLLFTWLRVNERT